MDTVGLKIEQKFGIFFESLVMFLKVLLYCVMLCFVMFCYVVFFSFVMCCYVFEKKIVFENYCHVLFCPVLFCFLWYYLLCFILFSYVVFCFVFLCCVFFSFLFQSYLSDIKQCRCPCICDRSIAYQVLPCWHNLPQLWNLWMKFIINIIVAENVRMSPTMFYCFYGRKIHLL